MVLKGITFLRNNNSNLAINIDIIYNVLRNSIICHWCQIKYLYLVKRETGENPVRTRHCNQGDRNQR